MLRKERVHQWRITRAPQCRSYLSTVRMLSQQVVTCLRETDQEKSTVPNKVRCFFSIRLHPVLHSYLRQIGYPKGSLKRLRGVPEKPSACSKLKSPAFITEYFSCIRKSLIRLINSPMRDSAFQALRFRY